MVSAHTIRKHPARKAANACIIEIICRLPSLPKQMFLSCKELRQPGNPVQKEACVPILEFLVVVTPGLFGMSAAKMCLHDGMLPAIPSVAQLQCSDVQASGAMGHQAWREMAMQQQSWPDAFPAGSNTNPQNPGWALHQPPTATTPSAETPSMAGPETFVKHHHALRMDDPNQHQQEPTSPGSHSTAGHDVQSVFTHERSSTDPSTYPASHADVKGCNSLSTTEDPNAAAAANQSGPATHSRPAVPHWGTRSDLGRSGLSPLPVSAVATGTAPDRRGTVPTGSDIVFDALMEEHVARQAQAYLNSPVGQALTKDDKP